MFSEFLQLYPSSSTSEHNYASAIGVVCVHQACPAYVPTDYVYHRGTCVAYTESDYYLPIAPLAAPSPIFLTYPELARDILSQITIPYTATSHVEATYGNSGSSRNLSLCPRGVEGNSTVARCHLPAPSPHRPSNIEHGSPTAISHAHVAALFQRECRQTGPTHRTPHIPDTLYRTIRPLVLGVPESRVLSLIPEVAYTSIVLCMCLP